MELRRRDAPFQRPDEIRDVRGVVDPDTQAAASDEAEAAGLVLGHAEVDGVPGEPDNHVHFSQDVMYYAS
jgi:hypothetical protein